MKTRLLFVVLLGVAMLCGAFYSWWWLMAFHCVAGVLTYRINGGRGAFDRWNLGKASTLICLIIGGFLGLCILAVEE